MTAERAIRSVRPLCEVVSYLEALAEVEREVRFIGAIPLCPIVIRDHIVSAVNKFEASAEKKPTDALSRQFAFTQRLGAVVIGETDRFMQRLADAVAGSAL